MSRTHVSIQLLAAVALGALLATCGGSSAPPRPTGAPAEAGEPALDPDKLGYISLLVRGRGITPDEWRGFEAENASASVIVDRFLVDPFLSEISAPRILFKHYLDRLGIYLLGGTYVLKEADGALYLTRPCRAADATAVQPWWDMSTTVKVCADSIRADVWETRPAKGKPRPCSALLASPAEDPTSPCGCGPNLVRCSVPSLRDRFKLQLQEEIRATVAHAVVADRPLSDLFVGNATVRSRDVELLYVKSNVMGLRARDPSQALSAVGSWSATGAPAARAELEDGQHAGLITSLQFQFHSGDLRQRMRALYEIMWCTEVTAPGALPEHLLALRTPDMARENDQLAARPICTTCHARLESAMGFFGGYASPLSGAWEFVPGASGEHEGPIYAADIRDLRGRGRLHPRGFAELAVRQPEFSRCMARNAVEYVFGPATTEDVVDRVAGDIDPLRITFRQLVRAALIEYLACKSCVAPAISLPDATHAGKPAHPPELSTLVDQHCTACHFDGADIPSLEGKLAPATVSRLLSQVVTGRMPPGGELPLATRLGFLTAARQRFPELFRASAPYLQAHANPPPALPLLVARAMLWRASATTANAPPLNAVENAVDGRDNFFTPNYSTLTAIEAFRSCAATTSDRDARKKCASELLDRAWSGTGQLPRPR